MNCILFSPLKAYIQGALQFVVKQWYPAVENEYETVVVAVAKAVVKHDPTPAFVVFILKEIIKQNRG